MTQARLNEILDGMAMDLHHARYPDFAGLERYCYHVAGVVGLLAAGIFGYANPQTLKYAETLGTAFQLTNIIRDVGEDARKNRIYLPQDELARFGVSAADILDARQTEGFGRLMAFQIDRAKGLLRARARAPAARGPQGPAPRPRDGGDLPHPARRDPARRLAGARAPRRADADPQALDRLADVGHRVAVVGAGWAGLAAAATLAERGHPVTVFEASRSLGGRARRVTIDGVDLDNGQHILIGAYAEALRLMRLVGADPERLLVRLPLELRYASGFHLRAPPLPAPLHLLAGLDLGFGV